MLGNPVVILLKISMDFTLKPFVDSKLKRSMDSKLTFHRNFCSISMVVSVGHPMKFCRDE